MGSPSDASAAAVTERWLRCFADHDLDGLMALYADHATHTSPKVRARHPETGGVLRGRDALRAWWAGAFARLPDLRFTITGLTVGETRVFVEYVRHASGERDVAVAEVLEVEAGRIVAGRVYHG